MKGRIEVTHVNGVWAVELSDLVEPVLFISGGRAERTARALALRLALNGWDARLQVRDKENVLVGEQRYWAGTAPGSPTY